jgi:DNA repair protein RadC
MKSVTINQEIFQIAEVELIYKSRVRPADRPQIITSKGAYEILIQTWDDNRIDLLEQYKVILLNRKGRVLGIYEVSTGGLHGTIVDTRLIFAAALKAGACSMILAHNHPSRELTPSDPDKEHTQKVLQGGKFLDIKVLDHLIVCRDGYFSFADQGLL